MSIDSPDVPYKSPSPKTVKPVEEIKDVTSPESSRETDDLDKSSKFIALKRKLRVSPKLRKRVWTCDNCKDANDIDDKECAFCSGETRRSNAELAMKRISPSKAKVLNGGPVQKDFVEAEKKLWTNLKMNARLSTEKTLYVPAGRQKKNSGSPHENYQPSFSNNQKKCNLIEKEIDSENFTMDYKMEWDEEIPTWKTIAGTAMNPSNSAQNSPTTKLMLQIRHMKIEWYKREKTLKSQLSHLQSQLTSTMTERDELLS